jgi:hypothetical protein
MPVAALIPGSSPDLRLEQLLDDCVKPGPLGALSGGSEPVQCC